MYPTKDAGLRLAILILNSGKVDPKVRGRGGLVLLHYLAREGLTSVEEQLLVSTKVHQDARNFNNKTPLHLAVQQGSEATLFQDCEGVDPNARDSCGRRPLHYAVRQGSEDIVKLFLDCKRVDPKARVPKNRTPLHLAVWRGFEVMVKLFMRCEKST